MANKTSQLNREHLRLKLNLNEIASGTFPTLTPFLETVSELKQDVTSGAHLNTPVLDTVCNMVEPSLLKEVLNMDIPSFGETTDVLQTSQQTGGAVSTEMQIPSPSPAHTTPVTEIKPFPPPHFVQQPIVLIGRTSPVRIDQSSSSTSANPPLPLDPTEEERRRERKKERNRLAARRCRENKLKKIDELQNEVKGLEKQRDSLLDKLRFLEQAASHTLQSVEEHRSVGCDLKHSEIDKLICESEELRSVINSHLSNVSNSRVRAVSSSCDSASTSE